MGAYDVLRGWFVELYEQFGDRVPEPGLFDRVVAVVEGALGDRLDVFLGRGDNGIAFRTVGGNVVKYTIDRNEAVLWNRLRGEGVRGIARVLDVLNLVSSRSGDSYLFVVLVEYVAFDLSGEQRRLVDGVLRGLEPPTPGTLRGYVQDRNAKLIRRFEELAGVDSAFRLVPSLLRGLAGRHEAYVYDLRADNFKVNEDGDIILIDPSVPNLLGVNVHPRRVMFEYRLGLVLGARVVVV